MSLAHVMSKHSFSEFCSHCSQLRMLFIPPPTPLICLVNLRLGSNIYSWVKPLLLFFFASGSWLHGPSLSLYKLDLRASLVAQWLRNCLPMQGTRVRALVWEDPTCRGATRPVSHNYWACASGACAPQQERPRRWEARAPRWRVAPARRN